MTVDASRIRWPVKWSWAVIPGTCTEDGRPAVCLILDLDDAGQPIGLAFTPDQARSLGEDLFKKGADTPEGDTDA